MSDLSSFFSQFISLFDINMEQFDFSFINLDFKHRSLYMHFEKIPIISDCVFSFDRYSLWC